MTRPTPQLSLRPPLPRAGFTVMETLAAAAILAILLALLLPTAGIVRKRMNTMKCASNLRQLHAGAMKFATDHNGWLPISVDTGNNFFREVGGALELRVENPYNPPDYDIFLCPERPLPVLKKLVAEGKGSSHNYGSYAENEWVCGVPPNNRPRKKVTQFTRPSSIWMIADANAVAVIYYPVDLPAYTGRAAFDHGGKIQTVMLDGHIESFTPKAFGDNEGNLFGIPTRLPAP